LEGGLFYERLLTKAGHSSYRFLGDSDVIMNANIKLLTFQVGGPIMPRPKSVPKKFEVAGMTLDMDNACLRKNGDEIHLTPKEAKLMALLMQNIGKVVSRSELMQEVWNTEYLGDTRTLDVHICWLRQKIEENPKIPECILTRRGQGYELRLAN
jgi:DNA-binding response OmpR family regulator